MRILKALCTTNHTNIEEILKNNRIADIKGNLNLKIVKLFVMQNNKGLTPLLMAVEMANLEMFRFLFDIMVHLQSTQGKC